MKIEISVFPCANIGQNDHSNPYIESATVLSILGLLITSAYNVHVHGF